MASSASTTRRILRSVSLYIGLLALFLYGTFANEQFLTIDNQRDVLGQVSTNGVMAIGMTLVILTGGIDLSVGSLLSVGSVVCAMLVMERGPTEASRMAIPSLALMAGLVCTLVVRSLFQGAPAGNTPGLKSTISSWVAGLVVAVFIFFWAQRQTAHGFGVVGVLLLVPAFGLLLGCVNGAIIAKGRLQPFIVTLAMMISAAGLAKFIAGHGGAVHAIYANPDASDHGASTQLFFNLAANLKVFGKELIPVPGIFFAASAVVGWLLLAKSRVGRYIYAVGGNEEAGRYSGLNTDRVKVIVYGLCGMLSALAAVLYCAQYQQGKADAGFGRELDAIAAVVIGGTSLMGGRGGIGGTVAGVFIFGYLKNILNLRGVTSEFQQILQGIIIIFAVLLQEGVFVRWIREILRRVWLPGAASPKG